MTCKICNSNNIYTYSHGKSELTSCRSCKISYNSIFPTKEELEETYKKNYKLSVDDLHNAERRRLFRYPENISLISDLMNYSKPPSSILDIGCDRGFFLDEARRYGYKVYGVELSQEARSYTQKINIDVKDDIEDYDRKFDVITMWHVLEHLENPKEFLEKVKSKLNRPGYLLIRVPDFGSYWSQFIKDKWDWFTPNVHLFHYNIESLGHLINSLGFSIEKIIQRKPNNILTKKSFKLSNDIFDLIFDNRLILKKKLARKVQDIIHSEIYVIAKLNYIKE